MKKILFLLLILFAYGFASAQTLEKHYAIDGTEWTTKYDRDKKEKLLWDKIDLNLKAALEAGRLGNSKGQEYHDIFKQLFQMCKESFETLRLADSGKEMLQNPEFRFFLKQSGVTVRNGITRNKETFNLVEYANCFDSVLREYSFNSDIIAELADPDGRTYNLEFVINDFSERMEIVVDRIEREMLAMDFKEETIIRLTPRFIASQQKQNRRQR